MTEKYLGGYNFDSSYEALQETEKQFFPTDGSCFEHYKEHPEIQAIEQLYLSQPDEPYSLRLRETVTKNGSEFTAALKDRGEVTATGLKRMEIETAISEEAFRYYKSKGIYPVLRKLRVKIQSDVTIDWCEGVDDPIIEIENLAHSTEAKQFYEDHSNNLLDRTGSPDLSSETLAHRLSPNLMPPTPEAISPQEILAQIVRFKREGVSPIIASISGRSGSGKSTITRKLRELSDYHMTTGSISTDDYHRGKAWLESTYGTPWTNWDAPEVYDTRLLNYDLWQFSQGLPIDARRFDFVQEESVIEGRIEPCELLLVEGIYAGSPDLEDRRHLHIAIPTPLATSIGRRLARDQQEGRLNASLADPKAILRYQLEVAEPMYQQQLAA